MVKTAGDFACDFEPSNRFPKTARAGFRVVKNMIPSDEKGARAALVDWCGWSTMEADTFIASLKDREIARRAFYISPYTKFAHLQWSACEIVKKIRLPDDTHDAEVLPMYVIRLYDGEEIEVYPEELWIPYQV